MSTWSAPLGADRRVRVRVTERPDGDLALSGDPVLLAATRRRIVDRPWVWLDQVHGAEVVVLGPSQPIEEVCGARADGIVTGRRDVVIAAHSADCATVAMWAPEGVIAVAHAGWRGLRAGVLAAVADVMRAAGATTIEAYAGPRICPRCYEFGEVELASMVERFGDAVVATAATGAPALDVASAVRIDLDRSEVRLVGSSPDCTSCEQDRLWSHRARHDTGRQALLVWIDR